MQLLRYAPRVYPGVVELVGALRGKARLAVVSGTWRANIQAVLDVAGLADAFDVIVAKEDVTHAQARPGGVSAGAQEAPAVGAGRRWRSRTRPPVSRPPAPRASAASPSAIAAPCGDWVEDATYIEGLEPVAALLERLGF